jgi:hypothetical protein
MKILGMKIAVMVGVLGLSACQELPGATPPDPMALRPITFEIPPQVQAVIPADIPAERVFVQNNCFVVMRTDIVFAVRDGLGNPVCFETATPEA